MIAPAALSLATATASSCGTYRASSAAPDVVTRPSVSNVSFTVIGSPCSGPVDSRLAMASSAATAAARARSMSQATIALSAGLSRSALTEQVIKQLTARDLLVLIACVSTEAVAIAGSRSIGGTVQGLTAFQRP